MNPFGPEALSILRTLFAAYRQRPRVTLDSLARETGLTTDVLKKFPNQKQPSSKTMASIYTLLRSAALEDDRFLELAQEKGARLLGVTRANDRDPYATFKTRAKLTEETQARLSKQLLGTYLALHGQRKGGFFLSHIRFFNSYSSEGLPTCKISRVRRDEDGVDEGDFVIDGAAFSKNGHMAVVGYDLDQGDMRNLFLLPMDGESVSYKGVVSGYDTIGPPAFSAKVFIERIPKNLRYHEVREQTGFFEEQDKTLIAIEEIMGKDHPLGKRLPTIASNAYIGMSVGN